MKCVTACSKCGKYKFLWFWVKPWKTKRNVSHSFCSVCFNEIMAEVRQMKRCVK